MLFNSFKSWWNWFKIGVYIRYIKIL
jgi:hypothetical protein